MLCCLTVSLFTSRKRQTKWKREQFSYVFQLLHCFLFFVWLLEILWKLVNNKKKKLKHVWIRLESQRNEKSLHIIRVHPEFLIGTIKAFRSNSLTVINIYVLKALKFHLSKITSQLNENSTRTQREHEKPWRRKNTQKNLSILIMHASRLWIYDEMMMSNAFNVGHCCS